MDANDDELARTLDLHGEGQEHRQQHAANDAAAVAAFYLTLTDAGIPDDDRLPLTLEWMSVGHSPIEWADDA